MHKEITVHTFDLRADLKKNGRPSYYCLPLCASMIVSQGRHVKFTTHSYTGRIQHWKFSKYTDEGTGISKFHLVGGKYNRAKKGGSFEEIGCPYNMATLRTLFSREKERTIQKTKIRSSVAFACFCSYKTHISQTMVNYCCCCCCCWFMFFSVPIFRPIRCSFNTVNASFFVLQVFSFWFAAMYQFFAHFSKLLGYFYMDYTAFVECVQLRVYLLIFLVCFRLLFTTYYHFLLASGFHVFPLFALLFCSCFTCFFLLS